MLEDAIVISADDRLFLQVAVERRFVSNSTVEEVLFFHAQRPYIKLREVFLGLGFLTFSQFNEILVEATQRLRLGEILTRDGVITTQQLHDALSTQGTHGGLLGTILVEQGHCYPTQLDAALQEQNKLRRFSDPAYTRPDSDPGPSSTKTGLRTGA